MPELPSPSGKMLVNRDGPVTTLTLNRPEVHNALDQELSAELNAAVKQVAVDRECRILIIRGAGDTFCAGDDVKGFMDFKPGDGPWEIRMYQETVNISNCSPLVRSGSTTCEDAARIVGNSG
jgi:enoyl-CoA hydratase